MSRSGLWLPAERTLGTFDSAAPEQTGAALGGVHAEGRRPGGPDAIEHGRGGPDQFRVLAFHRDDPHG